MRTPFHMLILGLFPVAILIQSCGPRILPESSYIGEWRTEGGGFERKGAVCARLAPPLEEVWRVRAGKGIEGSPVPVGEIVIVATTDGNVKAYRLEDGESLWEKRIKAGFFAAPVVAGGRVFISSEYPDGRLYCLDLERGDTIWQATVGPCRSGSTVEAGVVYTINNAGEIFSHAAGDGHLLWKRAIPSLQTQSPIVSGNSLFVICDRNTLRLASTVDGDSLDVIAFDYDLSGSAAMLKDRIMLGSKAGIGMVAVSEEEKEIDLLEAADTYRLAASEDIILGTDGRRKAFAIDSRSGEELWTRSTDGLLEASPAIAGDTGVIVSLSGEIELLDLLTGELRWADTPDVPLSSAPVVSGDLLLLATERGELIAYSSRDGLPTERKVAR